MNPLLSTPVLTLYYVLMFQPFALLHFLPFRSFLPEGKKKRMVRIWVLLVVAEYVAFTGLLQNGFFSNLQRGYWILGYVAWVPQFLLSLLAERKLWMGQLFVLSFRALLSGIFFTVTRALVLYLYPGYSLDELYGLQVLTYGAMIFLSFPFLLRFFTRTFSGFREASTRKYWRFITAVPMLMAIESLYISLIDSNEMYFELLIPRLFLLVVVVFMMASIRSGQEEVYHELQMFEEKHDLQQQYASAEHYVQMARESRERLNDIFREKQDHINQLLVLIHRKDKDGVLRYIEELGEQFNTTKLPQYCQNTLINAALTVYIAKAKELDIPVTVSADLPQDITCSGDLSIVLSNLVENALIASEKQPEDKRNITVVALRQGDMLNILVKNLFDAPVQLGEDGLPVTYVKGHGIGMKSLARFRDKYGASILCQQKGGWFMTYLQVSAQAKGIGD